MTEKTRTELADGLIERAYLIIGTLRQAPSRVQRLVDDWQKARVAYRDRFHDE